jgi:hypothetical protein
MSIKKSIGFLAIFCTGLLPCALNAQSMPKIMTVTRVHFDPNSGHTFDEWKAVEKEYFDKVTLKNDLILGANVLVHFYTNDNSEVLIVSTYASWEDIEKASGKSDELVKAAWPDSVKRDAFFKTQASFYTTMHSDEIRSILPDAKLAAADTSPLVYNIRTMHFAFPADGKQSELRSLMKEYNENVIQKNPLLKGYYPSRHAWGADSRELIESFVYTSLADMDKANKNIEALVKAHWPDEKKRKEFFDKLGKYFEKWHGDAIYTNVPELRKIAKPAK